MLASEGVSFLDIELLLSGKQKERQTTELVTIYYENFLSTSMDPVTVDFQVTPENYVSNDFLMTCFIAKWKDMQAFFIKQMSSVTQFGCSCDHTFKLAKHVGMFCDGRWIPQYDSLFIMMNEIGEVTFWQLTMGTSFIAVVKGMESLQRRAEIHKKNIEIICIDNCCSWRRKITDCFGKEVHVRKLVKLTSFMLLSVFLMQCLRSIHCFSPVYKTFALCSGQQETMGYTGL